MNVAKKREIAFKILNNLNNFFFEMKKLYSKHFSHSLQVYNFVRWVRYFLLSISYNNYFSTINCVMYVYVASIVFIR